MGKLFRAAGGLSEREAQERLAKYGPNRLRPPHRRGPLLRLLGQFHNVLIYVLLGAALITALPGHWVDTSVILGVVMVNALIEFVQEGKAEWALEAVRNMLSLQATVLSAFSMPLPCSKANLKFKSAISCARVDANIIRWSY